MYFLTNGAVQPLIGTLSDRLSRDVAATITMSVGVVGFGLLVVGDGLAVAIAGVACIGVAMTWGAPVQSRFMDVLEELEQGIGFGLVRTVYMTVGSLGSVIVGATADVLGWVAAFGLLSVIMAIALEIIVANRALSLGL